jgi:hypothetical protein
MNYSPFWLFYLHKKYLIGAYLTFSAVIVLVEEGKSILIFMKAYFLI